MLAFRFDGWDSMPFGTALLAQSEVTSTGGVIKGIFVIILFGCYCILFGDGVLAQDINTWLMTGRDGRGRVCGFGRVDFGCGGYSIAFHDYNGVKRKIAIATSEKIAVKWLFQDLGIIFEGKKFIFIASCLIW